MKVSESDDMEEAAEAIHCDDVQLCRRLGKVSGVFATILWIFDNYFYFELRLFVELQYGLP